MNSSVRLDPLELLRQQEATRLPWLLPERRRRMAESPFAFFRGAAIVMAADLGRQPHSGLMVQLCGDAHLLNFGFYGSPERQLLFGINDFDETHPGPFEWDVQRLAASFVLAARSLGLSEKQQSKVCRRTVRAYGEAMAEFAAMPQIPMWVAQLPLERLIDEHASANFRGHLKKVTTAALQRDSRQAVRKLCEPDGSGELRFRHQPPLIWRFDALDQAWLVGMDWHDWLQNMLRSYMGSISSTMQHLLALYQLKDSALKAVGVGSIGTRCGISLFRGQHPDDILVLQGKQAEPSVLAPYVNLPAPEHQGQRVVEGQRLLQTASDAFLGWGTNPAGDHSICAISAIGRPRWMCPSWMPTASRITAGSAAGRWPRPMPEAATAVPLPSTSMPQSALPRAFWSRRSTMRIWPRQTTRPFWTPSPTAVNAGQGRPRPEPPAQGAVAGGRSPATAG